VSNKLYGLSKHVSSGVFTMTKCKCEKGEHHKEMNREERIDHLEDCIVQAIHKLECIKDELKILKSQ
jgi:hypothetical protein